MTYVIKCCNCYFDMYLLEINQRPKITDPERKNLLILFVQEKKGKNGNQKTIY